MPINPKTIILTGPEPHREEAVCTVAVTPGHILQRVTNAETIKPHVDGCVQPLRVALENSLEGEGITDVYAIGDRVQYGFPQRGQTFYGILAASQTIQIGDKLVSNGDGTLKKQALTSTNGTAAGAADLAALKTEAEKIGDDVRSLAANIESVVGVAKEAVTTTGSTARIRVEAV